MGVDAEMLVKTRTKFTKSEVRNLAVDICEAFGHSKFWIFKGKDYSHEQHALELVDAYYQDGDDILPEPGEYFIRANICSRYYGEGYERGDWPLIYSVARWLRIRIPDSRIFYGGDSSGICAEELTEERSIKLWNLFAKTGHKNYRGGFSSVFANKNDIVICEFCGNRPLISTGGGGGDTFWSCVGCGDRVITRNGKSFLLEKNEDFFKAVDRIRKEDV